MSPTLLYWPSWIGKSTVWAILAEMEWRKHVDTDREFIKKHGDIWGFIRKYGIEEFRIEEWKILQEYIQTWSVVSLWWWTLLLPENQELADSTGNIITLMTDVETIVTRILWDTQNHRPLAKSEEEIRRLYNSRFYHYIWQKIVLNLNGNDSPEEVIGIIQRIQIKTNWLLPIC